MNFTEEELREMEEKTSNMTEDEANLYLGTKALENISGQVWFTISEHYGKYYISLYYDNLKTEPTERIYKSDTCQINTKDKVIRFQYISPSFLDINSDMI